MSLTTLCISLLLKVKEQTGINYFTVNQNPGDHSMELWIYAPTAERARMARLLVDVNFKQQLKLTQAEDHLKRIQNDLTSVQSELVSGIRVEFKASTDLIGLMIGKGGARIQEVLKATGVKSINVETSGMTYIYTCIYVYACLHVFSFRESSDCRN